MTEDAQFATGIFGLPTGRPADGAHGRDPLEVLASEFVAALRQGEEPEIDALAASHPDLAVEIQRPLPALDRHGRLEDLSRDNLVRASIARHLAGRTVRRLSRHSRNWPRRNGRGLRSGRVEYGAPRSNQSAALSQVRLASRPFPAGGQHGSPLVASAYCAGLQLRRAQRAVLLLDAARARRGPQLGHRSPFQQPWCRRGQRCFPGV